MSSTSPWAATNGGMNGGVLRWPFIALWKWPVIYYSICKSSRDLFESFIYFCKFFCWIQSKKTLKIFSYLNYIMASSISIKPQQKQQHIIVMNNTTPEAAAAAGAVTAASAIAQHCVCNMRHSNVEQILKVKFCCHRCCCCCCLLLWSIEKWVTITNWCVFCSPFAFSDNTSVDVDRRQQIQNNKVAGICCNAKKLNWKGGVYKFFAHLVALLFPYFCFVKS